jgi:hypothetical protein
MSAIVRSVSAEEAEYHERLAGIEQRQRRIGDLQADLELLKLALARFEFEYRARVGPIQAEIDRVRLELAEYRRRIAWIRAGVDPDPLGMERDVDETFAAQRQEVEAEAAEARRYQQAFRQERHTRRVPDPATDGELRRLYRELAKRFHPDLATEPAERERREEIMLRINAAFRDRDLAGLRRLAGETERDDPAFAERSLADKLAWAMREAERLDGVVAELEAQIALLRTNDTYKYWSNPDDLTTSVARLADNARTKLSHLQTRLEERIALYRRLHRRRWAKPGERAART